MEEKKKKRKKEKKKSKLEEVIKIFWVFIIASIIGYIFEFIVVLFQKGYYECRQGLIYGPFIPVYGIGAIVYYLFFYKIKTRNKLIVFLLSMILGGITEYLCSFVQEMVFGTISWDYSYLPFNVNGRTSLLHCTYWGIAGIMYIMWVEPLINKIGRVSEKKVTKLVTIIVALFMLFNIVISSVAMYRQTQRLRNVQPQNKLDVFLDKYYPDEYLDKIYANKKNVTIVDN